MPLDDVVTVIETIQQRIRDHGNTLRQNETRTRMALIDPLLTALGWDVADPGLVTGEYDLSGQRADYALLNSSGNPSAFVEALNKHGNKETLLKYAGFLLTRLGQDPASVYLKVG